METPFQNDVDNSIGPTTRLVFQCPPSPPEATIIANEEPSDSLPKKRPRHLRSAPLRRLKHSTEKSVAGSFAISVLAVMLAIVLGVPLMIFTGLLYPFALLLRITVAVCCRCWTDARPVHPCWCCCWCCCCLQCRGGKGNILPSMLSATDVMWLHDSDPGNGAVAHCLLFVERGLDLPRIRDIVMQRIIHAEHENGTRLYPRLVQRVVSVSSGFCWQEDKHFDIEKHVFWAPVHARTKKELEAFMATLVEQPLCAERPLWEIQVIPYFERHRDTVLLVRIHQCITDGMSLVKMLCYSLADGQNMLPSKPRFGGTTFPLNVFRAFVVGPVTFLAWLFGMRSDCNPFQTKHSKTGRKVVTWSSDIGLAQIVRIKQVTRSALNDVILAALAGSLRTYFQRKGISNPYDLKINITIDLRYEPKHGKTWVPMGTEFSLVNLPLPTNTEGAIPQLWEVRNRLDDLKTSADAVVMYGAVHILHTFFPSCLARSLLDCVLRRASLLYSNLAGPEVPLLIASHRLKSVVYWMPPRDGIPVALSIFTYSDTMKIAIMADKGILPNPEPIITGFIAQIDKMSKLLASRRIPGEHRRRSFVLIGREETFQKPPIEELQQKLHDVQDELHAITQSMDAAALMAASSDQQELNPDQMELNARVTELKEQFSELLAELRRRKSLAEGIPISIEDDDEDLDGELRRPRKRALSVSSSRKSSISVTSTTRPLTTPTSSQHSALSLNVDSEVSASPSQEQQRALLDHDQSHLRRPSKGAGDDYDANTKTGQPPDLPSGVFLFGRCLEKQPQDDDPPT